MTGQEVAEVRRALVQLSQFNSSCGSHKMAVRFLSYLYAVSTMSTKGFHQQCGPQ